MKYSTISHKRSSTKELENLTKVIASIRKIRLIITIMHIHNKYIKALILLSHSTHPSPKSNLLKAKAQLPKLNFRNNVTSLSP